MVHLQWVTVAIYHLEFCKSQSIILKLCPNLAFVMYLSHFFSDRIFFIYQFTPKKVLKWMQNHLVILPFENLTAVFCTFNSLAMFFSRAA